MIFWQIYQKFLYELFFFLEQLNSPLIQTLVRPPGRVGGRGDRDGPGWG